MNSRNIFIFLSLFFITPAFSRWTVPVPVTVANDPAAEDWSPFITTDGLTLYFARVRSSSSYYGKICAAIRNDIEEPFSSARVLDCPLNRSSGHQLCPWVSCDNLRMYYHNETGGVFRLMLSERESLEQSWPAGKSVEEVNVLGRKIQAPSLTQDELTIIFDAADIPGGAGDYDLWMATRPDRKSKFTHYRELSEINTKFCELGASISPDGLELYFTSNRIGQSQIYKASRANTDMPFENIQLLSQFTVQDKTNAQPELSYNRKELYFTYTTHGDRSSKDIYVSYYIEDDSFDGVGISSESLFEIIENDK